MKKHRGQNDNVLLSCWLTAAQLFLARDSNFRCTLQIYRDAEVQIEILGVQVLAFSSLLK